MTSSDNNTIKLPSFKKPPLTEAVLSVQFEPLQALQAPQVGLLWSSNYRKKYPHTEQHSKIGKSIEWFGSPEKLKRELKLEFGDETETPRCWFVSEDGTELIQIQQDRLLHNWRKTKEGDGYPRYESVREEFKEDLKQFYNFVKNEKIGIISPNQCEVIYINHITADEVWKDHSDLGNVIPSWNPKYSDDYLWEPENIKLATQYIFNKPDSEEPWGRLYINIQPAFLIRDKQPIYTMTLTARGCPLTPDLNGILQFLDFGRENIVRGFTSFTSEEMHKMWIKE